MLNNGLTKTALSQNLKVDNMNNTTKAKFTKIQLQFKAAGKTLPVTEKRYDLTPCKNGEYKGVKIQNVYVWGISCREYWKYLKSL